MEMNPQTIDVKTGEIMDESQALQLRVQDRSLVFGTHDPEQIIVRATAIANRLKDVVTKSHMWIRIGQREYVMSEGWSTMLAMLGVFPQSLYCHRLERTKDEITYEAKITLKHWSGITVGCGEGLASSLENKPWSKSEFSIKSMAQTRALGKAARLSFSWIVALAGYFPTPAEEMPEPEEELSAADIDAGDEVMSDTSAAKASPIEMDGPPPDMAKARISEKQAKRLWKLAKDANIADAAFNAELKNLGVKSTFNLNMENAAKLETWIEKYRDLGA